MGAFLHSRSRNNGSVRTKVDRPSHLKVRKRERHDRQKDMRKDHSSP